MTNSAEKSSSERDKNSGGGMRLRPKARILKTLGEELISSEAIALIELVKNSYDADAENVLIKFEGRLQKGEGAVSVIDDGHGMDDKTIQNAWMVIATENKKGTRWSRHKKRRLLGEKGVGRFAASRLASELELFTRPSLNSVEYYAYFDWSQFENPKLFLDEIQFLMEERKPKLINQGWPLAKYSNQDGKDKSGTLLKMSQLKHSWEIKDLKELQRGLSRLISPFNNIEDFNIYLELPEPFTDYSSKIEPPEIINYPHYIVKGAVESDGKFSFTVKVNVTDELEKFEGFMVSQNRTGDWEVMALNQPLSDDEWGEKQRPLSCGPITFELRVWDRDELDNVIQKVGEGLRSVRKDLDAVAGVNIYRDGFRVMPYGEPNNDWLRLDLRRVQKPTMRLSNNQITGYISISADNNPDLHDRSNREGLDNNAAYSDLVNVMENVLTKLENVRYRVRRSEKKPQNKSPQKHLFDSPDFSAIREAISEKKLSVEDTAQLVNKVESDWKQQVESFKEVISQYHALATLGGIVDKVLHDGRQPLATIQTESGLGREAAEELVEALPQLPTEEIENIKLLSNGFKTITEQANVLRDVFRRVEPFGGRKRGRPKKYYIEDLIKDNFSMYQRELTEAGVQVELPDTQTLVSIDVTELTEIVTNLVTNSLYWLHSVPKSKRFIKVRIKRLEDQSLEMIFADSGPGIDGKNKDHIFEPYFSERPDGHGLGLCLVGEIVKDYYNGSVELLDSGNDAGAVFRIILRKRV